MRGNETPERIVIGVGIYDVITSANFYDYHLRGLSLVEGGGVKFWAFPSTCVVAITTLSHYRANVRTTVRMCDYRRDM